MAADFDKQKNCCLSQADLSRKGSIDNGILDLVNYINSQNDYFTTSSCSGRISIFSEPKEEKDGRKKNCEWLYVSHEDGDEKEVVEALQHCTGNGVFKFEAFVLHTQCRSIQDAQLMLKAALESGFRNSGIVIGKKERIILAVRSTHGLEVPLVNNGDLLVSVKYLRYLVHIANEKMRENTRRVERFFSSLKNILHEAARKKANATDQTEIKSYKQTSYPVNVSDQKEEKKCLHNASEQERILSPLKTKLNNLDSGKYKNNGMFNTEDFIECLSTFYQDT